MTTDPTNAQFVRDIIGLAGTTTNAYVDVEDVSDVFGSLTSF